VINVVGSAKKLPSSPDSKKLQEARTQPLSALSASQGQQGCQARWGAPGLRDWIAALVLLLGDVAVARSCGSCLCLADVPRPLTGRCSQCQPVPVCSRSWGTFPDAPFGMQWDAMWRAAVGDRMPPVSEPSP
jgi:hypothetical protein